jgi:hypothetical protein
MMRPLLCGAFLACAAFPHWALAQANIPTSVQIVGHVLKPEKLEPTKDRLGTLKLPPDFKIGSSPRI